MDGVARRHQEDSEVLPEVGMNSSTLEKGTSMEICMPLEKLIDLIGQALESQEYDIAYELILLIKEQLKC